METQTHSHVFLKAQIPFSIRKRNAITMLDSPGRTPENTTAEG